MSKAPAEGGKRPPKKHTKNSENGFVPLRRGIYEHLDKGKMTGREFMIYTFLLLKADHKTGICWKISAPMIAKILRLKKGVREVRRSLSSLEKKGYIRRFNHRGQVLFYPLAVNRYVTSSGKLIDAHNPLLAKAVTEYLKGALEVNGFLSGLSTISKEDITYDGKGRKQTKSFTPPTPEEVKKYATSVGFPALDAEYFCEYYTANGWRLKGGKKMRSWKRMVDAWIRNRTKGEQDTPKAEPLRRGLDGLTPRQTFRAELEKEKQEQIEQGGHHARAS